MKIKGKVYKMLNSLPIFSYTVQLSLTDLCNKACDFCPIHGPLAIKANNAQGRSYLNEEVKTMTIDVLKKAMDNFYMFKKIELCGRGEPLLYPQLKEAIAIIDRYNIPFTITTNGILLQDNLWLLDVVNLAFIRVSNNKTIEHPKIKHAKIYTSGDNGDIPVVWVDGLDGMAVKQQGFSKTYIQQKGCTVPYHFAVISPSGNVYPCCHSSEVMGNVANTSFDKIVLSKKMKDFRGDIYNTDRTGSDCSTCGHFVLKA